MSLPLDIMFLGLPQSPALAAAIAKRSARLARHSPALTGCRVVVGEPHRYHRHGRRFAVQITLTLPRGKIEVRHEPPALVADAAPPATVRKRSETAVSHRDAHAAVNDAFDAAKRRLEERAKKLRAQAKRKHPRN
jgi:ribosome-associated translation inhibitor RaiA